MENLFFEAGSVAGCIQYRGFDPSGISHQTLDPLETSALRVPWHVLQANTSSIEVGPNARHVESGVH